MHRVNRLRGQIDGTTSLQSKMLYSRHGNAALLGDFGELLPHRFLDGRLRELGTNVVGLVMEFWRPMEV